MTEVKWYTFTYKVLPQNVSTVATKYFFVSGWASGKQDEQGYVTYSGFMTGSDLEKVKANPMITDFRYEDNAVLEKRFRERNAGK